MSSDRLPGIALARRAAATTVVRPSTLVPVLILLLPTLLLQVVAVGHLRTRLAPAMWTVAAGGVFLVWWQQVATMAAFGLVGGKHQRSRGSRWQILRVAVTAGTRVTIGLALLVIPGLWLQARHAYAPILAAGGAGAHAAFAGSASATRRQQAGLLGVMTLALLAGLGLQSAVAVAAEAFGTIHVVGSHPDGRAIFAVRMAPHVATSVLAWLAMAWVITVQALSVRLAHADTTPALASTGAASLDDAGGVLDPRWRLAGRVAGASALAAGLLAVIYKVQQHIS